MSRAVAAIAVSVVLPALCWLALATGTAADAKPVRFDVNDVSFLWPAPKTKEDAARLISVEEKLEDGESPILSQEALDSLLGIAGKVVVKDSADRENSIRLQDSFKKRSAWRIAAIRIDPSAPGAGSKLVEARGSLPQIRLVIQPVTVTGDSVQVHDVAAHLVFNYDKEIKPPAAAGKPPFAVPDKEKFAEIVKDLASIKDALKKAGVATEGKLAVHPGFGNDKAKDFPDRVKALLKKHLSVDRLGAMALMGIDPPEPWIFFAVLKQKDGKFALAPNPSLGGNSAQMLILRGGTPVMPRPATTNVDADKGVSTALLFPDAAGKAKLDKPVFEGLAGMKHKDVPDLIANPQRAHFFNTDCVSCHTESTRRAALKTGAAGAFAYKLPDGVSGADDAVLPKDGWNVRNFGWFPDTRASAVATATLRTANESAESAEFINKSYLAPKE